MERIMGRYRRHVHERILAERYGQTFMRQDDIRIGTDLLRAKHDGRTRFQNPEETNKTGKQQEQQRDGKFPPCYDLNELLNVTG